MFRHIRNILVIIVIFGLFLWLPIFSSLRSQIRILVVKGMRPLSALSRTIYDYYSIVATLQDVLAENQRLKDDSTKLLSQVSKLDEITYENNLLRHQLSLPQEETTSLITAAVVGYDPFGSMQSVLVNKGKNGGVSIGAGVVSNGFLVGQVTGVDEKTAIVQLISSHRIRLAVRLQESRAPGLLHGGIQGVVVEDIPIDISVKLGEMVVTAGQVPGIRPGTPIGTVDQILSSKSDIYQTMLVKIPIALRSLDIVFIEKEST